MSSKKNNLSDQEKRAKLMEIFRDGKEFYQMKDIERIAKEKGLVQKYIKGAVQALVDDGTVKHDKIGAVPVYWSFPVKKSMEQKKSIEQMKTRNKELNERLDTLKETLKVKMEEQYLKPPTTDDEKVEEKIKCKEIQTEIKALKAKEKELTEILENTKKVADKADFDKIKAQTAQLEAATNRWTDNVYNCMNWIIKKFHYDKKTINKQFRIPDNFEYYEAK